MSIGCRNSETSNCRGWILEIIGDGRKKALEAECRKLCLFEHVQFVGAHKNEDSVHALETSDVLILPADGRVWGAVIDIAPNVLIENLLQGIY